MISLSKEKIDFDAMREAIGTCVSDGYYEYVVADYSMSNNVVKLWCKKRQAYYSVIPKVFDSMICVSGTF